MVEWCKKKLISKLCNKSIPGNALLVCSKRSSSLSTDFFFPKGALVYVVNTSLPGGSGPIQVKPGVKSEYEFLQDAPMAKGETYTYKNISVEVLESNAFSDKLKVKVN